jgi:hypothetical protein
MVESRGIGDYISERETQPFRVGIIASKNSLN